MSDKYRRPGYNKAYSRQSYVKDRYKRTVGADSAVINAIKENSPCVDCGKFYPYYVMDFDHRPGEEKKFNISKLRKLEERLEEAKKCDIVCANCHRARTFFRVQEKRVIITTDRFTSTVPGHYASLKTHCKKGHPLSGDNLYLGKIRETGGIHRRCKICTGVHNKASYRRNRDRKKGKE